MVKRPHTVYCTRYSFVFVFLSVFGTRAGAEPSRRLTSSKCTPCCYASLTGDHRIAFVSSRLTHPPSLAECPRLEKAALLQHARRTEHLNAWRRSCSSTCFGCTGCFGGSRRTARSLACRGRGGLRHARSAAERAHGPLTRLVRTPAATEPDAVERRIGVAGALGMDEGVPPSRAYVEDARAPLERAPPADQRLSRCRERS